MNESDVSKIDIIELETTKDSLSPALIYQLEEFTRCHYQLHDLEKFKIDVLGINKAGAIGFYYDSIGKLIGFTPVYRQGITMKGKHCVVYTGGTYYDQTVNLGFAAAKFGLSHAMKFKLAHPESELVYFANANSPSRYHFLASFNDTIYPKQDIRTPENVLQLVQRLKELNQWQSDARHPMLITGQLPIKNIQKQFTPTNSLHEFYLEINPDFHLGTSLLVYLPLSLATIGQGIKQVVSMPSLLEGI